MGKLVIPVMCSILFILVIGSSDDAFAELKTCNGYIGLWTDGAAWSPAGQPATTDTLSITNCNLTIPSSTNILIEEGLPPSGIDFLLQPAYAIVFSDISGSKITMFPESTLTFDVPNSDLSFSNTVIDATGVGELRLGANTVSIDGLRAGVNQVDVAIEIVQLNLVSVAPVEIRGRSVSMFNTAVSDAGSGGVQLRIAAESFDFSGSTIDLQEPGSKLKVVQQPASGPPTPSLMDGLNLSLTNGADGAFRTNDLFALPVDFINPLFNVGSGSTLDFNIPLFISGDGESNGEGKIRYFRDTSFGSGTFTSTTTDVFGPQTGADPTFLDVQIDYDNETGKLSVRFNTDATVQNGGSITEKQGLSTNVYGSLTIASGGTLNIDPNGLVKIRNGGTFTLDSDGTVNNDERFVVQGSATGSLSGDFNNNSGGQTDNWGSTSLETGGSFNDLGKFRGNPIVDNS